MLQFHPLHPCFAAEVRFAAEAPVSDLRQVDDRATLDALRDGMDRYGVLVVHNQPFSDDEQLAFAERFDGTVQRLIGTAAIGKNRIADTRLADISNLDDDGRPFAVGDRRRMYSLANRQWHTDSSFREPIGRYSMLSARVIPAVPADTEFADMRGAYDALDAETQALIEGLRVHHSIAWSRQQLGFEFSSEELAKLKGAVQPLVLTHARTGRRALYLASHATHVVDWPVAEGRLLLADLMAHATQRRFVYAHSWRENDFVIWDNRCTMHRARPFDDTRHVRELRRVTTLDEPTTPATAAPSFTAA